MHGYDTYDCGARGMYPALMRFTTPDPLAEKYYSISSYAYCSNNPVKYIDPDGRLVKFAPKVSQDFKDKFTATVKYMNSKGTNGFLKSLNDSKEVYYINETTGNQNKFQSKDKTILWNPNLAKLTDENAILSPATLLNHELDHANQFDSKKDEFVKNATIEDKQYDNLEEKRVIEGSEQETAKKHGEISNGEVTRKNHRMKGYIKVSDPTSTGEAVVTAPKKKEDQLNP